MRHATEPALVCAEHRTKLNSRITTDGDGGLVELIEPCQECRRPRFVLKQNGNGHAPKSKPPVMRTLTCADCGTQWERPAQRGRVPLKCEGCRG